MPLINKMKKVTVIEGQSIWDISLQQYGSIEGVFQLLMDNSQFENVNSDIFPGMELLVSESIVNNKVSEYYDNNKVSVISGRKLNALVYQFNADFNCDYTAPC